MRARVAFTVYEEPAYEWVETTCSYVPDLGLFSTDCNTSGDPLFSQAHVLSLDLGRTGSTRIDTPTDRV